MPRKKEKESSQPAYWKSFLDNFNTSARIWLEGYGIATSSIGETIRSTYMEKTILLNKKKLATLREFSKKNNIDPVVIFHTAWAILLNRYTDTDDVIYGKTTFEKKGKSKKIAIHSTILPVRSLVSAENESIEVYLKKLALQLQKNEKHSKEFLKNQSVFKDIYHYLFLYPAEKSTKNHSPDDLDLIRFPLSFIIKKIKSLEIAFIYNANRFTKNSIKNLEKHFILIIDKMILDKDAAVTHFSILTEHEKKYLLNQWNAPTDPNIPCPDLKTCVQDLFAIHAKKNPNNLAISNIKITLTYQQVDTLSNQIANFLINKNIKTGDTVAVLMERTPALLVVMMAIFKIGAIYVPINPKYPDDRIEFVLKDCGAPLILTNTFDHIPKDFMEKVTLIDDQYNEIKSFSTNFTPIAITADKIAYVIYTSGTTGQPKGVMIKHVSLINLVYWYKVFFKVTHKDRSLQFASQAFDCFFCETMPFFCQGGSVHIIEDHIKLTPTLLLPWIQEQKITICDIPTAYAQILLTLPWPTSLSLRLIKIGGESLQSYPKQKFSFDIWNGYGPTEGTVETTFHKVYEKNTPPVHKPLPPFIGKPIANTEVYVLDHHLEPVPIGDVGELFIGGINVSAGYLNRPQLTREKFIRNFFSNDPNAKLYRTGDLARWSEIGELEFIGRVDHQVKIRGYRIELSEIETNIRKFPDIREVVVLAKETSAGQKTLVAYLVPRIDKIRIPYHERCLIALSDMRYVEAATDDISREGIALTSLSESVENGQMIRMSVKLPGSSDFVWLTGKIVWHMEQRAGIEFEKNPEQIEILNKSIEYYLATHNLMETLKNAAAKRSIRQALKRQLPEYMIPSVFSILPQFPLTFNGKIDWKALPPPQDFERLLDRQQVPPRTETEKILAKIWCTILNISQVSITDNFFDLGGNSLMVSQLSVKILEKFKMSIPAKIFFDLPFIPILAEYIDSKGQKSTFRSNIQDEISHDAVLNDDILPNKIKNSDYKNPRGILLTGAAGFLGIYLLRELLQQTDAKIYCLIRKSSQDSPAHRLMETVAHYQLSNEISLANRRIILISSDMSNDRFGIPTEQYENLAEKVDVIFHCGAQVNTMSSYSNLRNSNVLGTLEVIKFATYKVDKIIHYVSTLSAAYKKDEFGHYSEEFPDADFGNLVGGYAISKWVSERLLTQIKNRGLLVNIYRSGYILGQSDTGIMNFNDALLLLIKGCIQLGFAPHWKEKICLLPVDFVSEAMVAIGLAHVDKSMVYHLDHPHGILWNDLISWLNNYGFAIKVCPHQEWRQYLTKITEENALFHFLPYYLSLEKEPKTPDTAIQHAREALKEIGLSYPGISDQLLQLYFNYLCRMEFLPTPQKFRTIIT